MATDKKRVQISMTEEIASKFDELTEFYGLSKSGLFAVLIREDYERKGLEENKKRATGNGSLSFF